MFAVGSSTSFPKYSKSSSIIWLFFKFSEKLAKILEESEISLVSIFILEDFVKAFTIGKNDMVAKAGASSVLV